MATTTITRRNNITPIFVLFSIILAAANKVAGEPPSVVPSACKAAYAAAGAFFTVDFCLSALEGHSPGAADYSDLVPIAVNLMTANATVTKAKLDALVAGGAGNNGALLSGLRSCQNMYGAVLRRYQPDCYAAVSDRRYGDARKCLRLTAEAAGLCEWWLWQRKVASPVAQDDDNLVKLANLAIALTIVA